VGVTLTLAMEDAELSTIQAGSLPLVPAPRPLVMVTGGAGFIGSSLVRRMLDDGRTVVLLDRFHSSGAEGVQPSAEPHVHALLSDRLGPQSLSPHLRVEVCDIRDGAAVLAAFLRHRPRVVCHLAAEAGVRFCETQPQQCRHTNVDGTRHVLEAARVCGAQHFLFASSSSVYGDQPTPWHEALQPRPQGEYARSKLMGELLCATASDVMRVTLLRMFSVYGPHGRGDMLVGTCVSSLHTHCALVIAGDGEQARDHTFVADVVRGWMAAIDASGIGGGVANTSSAGCCTPGLHVFNLGTGRATTVNDTLALLSTACQRQTIQRLYKQAHMADVRVTHADTSHARQLLGFSAAVALEDGLQRCSQHWLATQRLRCVGLVATLGSAERWQLFVDRCLPSLRQQAWHSMPPAEAGQSTSLHPLSLLVLVEDSGSESRAQQLRLEVQGLQHDCPFPIVLLSNRRAKGASGAWNTGLLHLLQLCAEPAAPSASSTYVSICDDDDAWSTHHVSLCMDEASRSGADLVVAGLIRHDELGASTCQSIPLPAELTTDALLVRNCHVQGSNLFARVDAVAAAGLFDERLPSCTDRDLLLRMRDLPSLRVASMPHHTVHHYAGAHRARLSTPDSDAKIVGLTRFWQKYRHRMSAPIAASAAERARQLFGWVPPSESSSAIPSPVLATLPSTPSLPAGSVPLPATDLCALLRRPVVVGVISDSHHSDVAPLLHCLRALHTCDFILSVDVLLLENGPRGTAEGNNGNGSSLSLLVESVRAAGLRCTLIPIEQQAKDHAAGALPSWVTPAITRRQSIAAARTCLQYYVALFARSLLAHTRKQSVLWILDDDKVWSPDVLHSQLAAVWKHALADGNDVAAVFGVDRDCPPLPSPFVCRTQLVDTLANLQRLTAVASATDVLPRCSWFSASAYAELTRMQSDFFHDLASTNGAHLECPFFVDTPTGGSGAELLEQIAGKLELVCAGGIPFRAGLAGEAAVPAPLLVPSICRGGCTLVFQPLALELIPNLAPVLGGAHTRRSDFVWSLLAQRVLQQRTSQCHRLEVRHVRSPQTQQTKGARELADGVLADVLGHAVVAALDRVLTSNGPAVGTTLTLCISSVQVDAFLDAFRSALSARAALLRASLYRIRALIALVSQLVESPSAWWNIPVGADVTAGIAASVRRLRHSIHLLSTVYVAEREVWEACLRRLQCDTEMEETLRQWLLHLPAEIQQRRTAMKSQQLCAAFERDVFVPHRELCARSALSLVLVLPSAGVDAVLLGMGFEGVTFRASSSSSVVYKVMDLFCVRASREQQRFVTGLMDNAEAKTLLGLQRIYHCGPHIVLQKAYIEGEAFTAANKARCESPVRLLHALHAAGLSCRDLKASNLLVGTDGRLQLLDVGMDVVAWSAREEESAMRKMFFTWHWAHRQDVRELMRRSRTERIPEMEAYERFRMALADPYAVQDELFACLAEGALKGLAAAAHAPRGGAAFTLVDYGCGDGKLLQRVAARLPDQFSSVHMVGYDPHASKLPSVGASAPSRPPLCFTNQHAGLAPLHGRCDVVVCSRVICCIASEREFRSILRDLASLVHTRGYVLLALCNPFFTDSDDTPVQQRTRPRCFDPQRVSVWSKVFTATGHRRDELHRPFHLLRHELLAAGLDMCDTQQTRTTGVRHFLPNSDWILITLRPVWRTLRLTPPPSSASEHSCAVRVAFESSAPPTTLLLKTCFREADQLYERVTHLVRQLEGPRAFAERIIVVDSKRDKFIREYRQTHKGDSAVPADNERICEDERQLRAVCQRLEAEGWVDRVLFADGESIGVRARCLRWFGVSDCPHTHACNGAPNDSTLFALESARHELVLQVDLDLLVHRRSTLHDYTAEAWAIMQRDPNAITVALNIWRTVPLEPTCASSTGKPHRVEVRGCFFHRSRLLARLPMPLSEALWQRHVDGSCQLRVGWYRAMDAAMDAGWACSYRGGGADQTFFVHPPNVWKRDLRDFGLLVNCVERGWIPAQQRNHVDVQGELWKDWMPCVPKQSAHYVFIVLGRNVPPAKVQRCFDSIQCATEGIRKHGLPESECTWAAVVIDDASDPHHSAYVRATCARLASSSVTLVQPRYQRDGGANNVLAMRHLVSNPHSVLITLDLDDALIGDELFLHLHRAYTRDGADCTIGGHLRTDKTNSPPNVYPATLLHPRRTRGGGNVWKHLRTFRQSLFARIRDEDLRSVHGSGAYFTHGTDWAMMLPIVESAFRPVELQAKLYLWDPHRHDDVDFFQRERRTRIDDAVSEIVRKHPYAKLRPTVAVVGDARFDAASELDARKKELAEQLGRVLVVAGYRVLTGGLGGCMEAVCAGARASAGAVVGDGGCTVSLLPGGSPLAANPFVDVALPTGLSHARNALVAQADALVVIAGGAGSLSELALAWSNGRMCIVLAPATFPDSPASLFADRPLDARRRLPRTGAGGFTDRVFPASTPATVVHLLHAHLHRYARRERAEIKSRL
jgi:uncharacterized protein (TIGR00725 family)